MAESRDRKADGLTMAAQLPLPLEVPGRFAREDFITGPANAEAVGLIDAWPRWNAPAAALYGPPGSGKTHLASVWAERAGARLIEAASLGDSTGAIAPGEALAVENVDAFPLGSEAESVLFALIERGTALLATGVQPPAAWPAALPDLGSRFRALTAFPLWAPDDALLEALAKKLFADRQLSVPDAVVAQMIRALERSPAAIRDFVAEADAAALARKSAISPGLIRDLLAKGP
jgi:chromosomal replication initiation ATPase DnaA